jgi:hypothetical protein
MGARLVQLERLGISSTGCGEGDGAHSGLICLGVSSFSDETPSSTVSSRGSVEWRGGGSNFNCNTACLYYSFVECDVSGLKNSSGVFVI